MKGLRKSKKSSKKKGAALITSFMLMALLSIAGVTYVSSATQTSRDSRKQTMDVQTTHMCEAGVQTVLRSLWRPFKISQTFANIDAVTAGSSATSPTVNATGTITGAGSFSAGVIAISTPQNNTYLRLITVRAVGWQDLNGNGLLDANEPRKVVDVTAQFELARSQVFDYTYFVNNYGWMDGFGQTDLIVNGDMRANGDFSFTNGSPTVNGSVYAASNDKLVPPAAGLVNTPPVKMANATYISSYGTNARVRQGYSSATMGAYGSANWENWRDFAFDTTAQIMDNKVAGAAIGDSTGIKSWARTASTSSPTTGLLDSTPTDEVIMPDLSDLTYYQNLSSTYTDPKATYGDGTANPNFGQGAWVKAWNTTTSSYQTISTNGIVSGSAALIGTAAHPVLLHGPVTFTQDAVVKGNFSGQGTIYAGRNVHLVGSIIYNNPPDFRGSNQTTIDNTNEKKDMVALAARGSVMMGDTSTFTAAYPLQYMEPPFTHDRHDENGNLIPAFNAIQTDSTGFKKYQSVMGDTYIHSISSGVNQIDAVLYTNFVGGGDIGTGGTGVQFNGSIISKDEAMVVFSLPMGMNYDSRIRERNLQQTALIDLQLPRSPVMLRSTWQDRGFSTMGG